MKNPKSDTKKVAKRDTISIRMSPQWDEYIEQVAEELSKKMDVDITKTWVVTQLMKMGLPSFEKKHNIRRKSDHLSDSKSA